MHWLSFPPEFQSTPLMRGETLQLSDRMHGRRKFQSTPLMRGETCPFISPRLIRIFQSTPLMRGETVGTDDHGVFYAHFNPLPSCEGRLVQKTVVTGVSHFNPLPSCEGRPRPPAQKNAGTISIHSPHARGDTSV